MCRVFSSVLSLYVETYKLVCLYWWSCQQWGPFVLSSKKQEAPLWPTACGSCCPASTHGDNVMWLKMKNILLSFSMMHGWSESLSQHNITTPVWLFNSLWRHFWVSVVSLSQTFHHTHSTAGKTPTGNTMTIFTDWFWRGHTQRGQSNDYLSNPEIWSPHSVTHLLTNVCKAGPTPVVQP